MTPFILQPWGLNVLTSKIINPLIHEFKEYYTSVSSSHHPGVDPWILQNPKVPEFLIKDLINYFTQKTNIDIDKIKFLCKESSTFSRFIINVPIFYYSVFEKIVPENLYTFVCCHQDMSFKDFKKKEIIIESKGKDKKISEFFLNDIIKIQCDYFCSNGSIITFKLFLHNLINPKCSDIKYIGIKI